MVAKAIGLERFLLAAFDWTSAAIPQKLRFDALYVAALPATLIGFGYSGLLSAAGAGYGRNQFSWLGKDGVAKQPCRRRQN